MQHTIQIEAGNIFNSLKIKENRGKRYVFDPIRKNWFLLSKEEWVRQIFIGVLSMYFSPAHISIEKKIKLQHVEKRFDLVVMDRSMNPYVLAEFKNPNIEINEKVFEQIALYNTRLKAPFLLVSNGIHHYLCEVNLTTGAYHFLEAIPFDLR